MDIQNIAVKFYANGGQDIDQTTLIPVFQRWIKDKALEDVMIDIADYRHVPNGPGMMLVCHEVNYGMDSAEANQLGLLAQRKQPQDGDHASRIAGIIRSSLLFLKQLANDPDVADSLTFDVSGFEYLSNDRLRVPNTDDGYNSVVDDLKAVGQKLYPESNVTVQRRSNHPKSRLAVRIESDSTDEIETLLAHL